MCATQQTPMQTEYLELQLSTAVVGAGSTEHSSVTWPGEHVKLGSGQGEKRIAVLLASPYSSFPSKYTYPWALLLMVIKSSYYGPSVMLRKNKIANLSVLFQLYFQWHEIWVDTRY